MELYKETGLGKIPFMKKYIQTLLAGNVKFLVFAHHLAVLAALEATVVKEKVKYAKKYYTRSNVSIPAYFYACVGPIQKCAQASTFEHRGTTL